MARCIKCNGSFLTRGKIKLKDAYICFKCADSLGFDHKTFVLIGDLFSWDDIKDGADAYYQRKRESESKNAPVQLANYGQARDVNATDEELQIFELVKEIADEDLELVRKSDNYVTAMLGDWDLARFKYADRAKWISLPIVETGNAKHKIESVEDVRQYAEALTASLEHIRKYL